MSKLLLLYTSALVVALLPASAQNVYPPIIPQNGTNLLPLNNTWTGTNTWTGGLSFPTTLGFGLGVGSLTIVTPGSGYAKGDTILLDCTGATFTQRPQLTVAHLTAGVVDSLTVTIPGILTKIPASCTLTQFSTSGAGTGLTVTGVFGVIASNLNFADLGSNGGAAFNGNLFLGAQTPNNAGIGGGENTFVGDRAGQGFTGDSNFNTAIGMDPCGAFGLNGLVTAGNNTCIGNDTARNMTGGTSFYENTFVGAQAGRGNITGGDLGNSAADNTGMGYRALYNNTTGNQQAAFGAFSLAGVKTGSGNSAFGYATGTYIDPTSSNNVLIGTATGQGNVGTPPVITYNTVAGAGAMGGGTLGAANFNALFGFQSGYALTTGGSNAGFGIYTLNALTSGSNNLALGPNVAKTTLTTGSGNILLGTGSNCDSTTGSESNTFRVCAASGSTPLLQGDLTAATPLLKVSGPVTLSPYTVATLPTCGGAHAPGGSIAYVTDASGPTYGSVLAGGGAVPVLAMCNGVNWTAH